MYSWMYDDVDIIISISARFDLANSIITRFISDEQYEKLKNNELESVEIIPRDNIPRKITLECINKRNLVDYNMLKDSKEYKVFPTNTWHKGRYCPSTSKFYLRLNFK
ncbi:hypothetical protein [Cryptosporidium hominis TU502]|uniref:hypothetical protein n=1 Tax=Cryptosporidium hominis (strain TU502) TaxID=353151 RepID=UPI0000452F1F|nr:hypothetical protein [Cryptosporidium hominis TU502]